MKLPPVEYEAPTTVADAIELLAEHLDEASVLAGGQSLIPLLALRLARPAVLIDINGIDELSGVSEAAWRTVIRPVNCPPWPGRWMRSWWCAVSRASGWSRRRSGSRVTS